MQPRRLAGETPATLEVSRSGPSLSEGLGRASGPPGRGKVVAGRRPGKAAGSGERGRPGGPARCSRATPGERAATIQALRAARGRAAPGPLSSAVNLAAPGPPALSRARAGDLASRVPAAAAAAADSTQSAGCAGGAA